MTDDESVPDNDGDEGFCEGDTPLEEIDWDQVAELEARQKAVLDLPEGEEREMGMLGLLHEMHGDEVEVL